MTIELIRQKWQEYTTSVSTPSMALSLETSLWMYEFLQKEKPYKILDLGTGFSSWLVHEFSEEGTIINSIDTNSDWLEKSQKFQFKNLFAHKEILHEYKTASTETGFSIVLRDEMIGYSKSLKQWTKCDVYCTGQRQFDFISLDIASSEKRLELLPSILKNNTHNGTKILIDDWHCEDYQNEVRKILTEFVKETNKTIEIDDLKHLKDEFGRYPSLVRIV